MSPLDSWLLVLPIFVVPLVAAVLLMLDDIDEWLDTRRSGSSTTDGPWRQNELDEHGRAVLPFLSAREERAS